MSSKEGNQLQKNLIDDSAEFEEKFFEVEKFRSLKIVVIDP